MSLLSIRSILKFLDLPWTKEMKHFLLTHTSRDKPRLVKNTVGTEYTVHSVYRIQYSNWCTRVYTASVQNIEKRMNK